jgi:SAM-dependent methyltransferase
MTDTASAEINRSVAGVDTPSVDSPTGPLPIRLNIGAGSTVIDGYTPLDIKTGTKASKLPYEDASVDEVYASHVLEHFPYERVPLVLAEWARVLRPGGIMRIGVPDMEKIAGSWAEGTKKNLSRYLLGGHIDGDDVHGAVFDFDLLRTAMHQSGIGYVQEFEPFANDTTKHPISLNLQGVKRAWAKIDSPKVALVLSQPRLGFTDHCERLIALAQHMKYGVVRASGAFWDRDIECATAGAINQYSPDFLLYSDYDSVFTPDDVQKMLDTINNDPTMAAIGAVQMSRHDDKPLVFEYAKDYNTPTTRVEYQHFGLTLIRREVFDELPHPWFWSVPGMDDQGRVGWTNGVRSDGDITFWRIMREHGFKVAQHNEVVIGHMVLCVKWPKNSGFGTTLQPVEMYNKLGKPSTATLNQDVYRKNMEDAAKAAAEKVTNTNG